MSKWEEINNKIKTKRIVEIPLEKFFDWCDSQTYTTLSTMMDRQLAESEFKRNIRLVFETIDKNEWETEYEKNKEQITREAREKEKQKFGVLK